MTELPIEQALDCALSGLGRSANLDQIEQALRLLVALADGADPLRLVALQEAAKMHLERQNGIRPRTAERLVTATFKNAQGHEISFEEPEPWPEPVDPAALLDNVVQVLRRYVVLPPWTPEAIALWVLHTYAIPLLSITPRLAILSPVIRCGKTKLLEVLAALVAKPLAASNVSPAATFRTIEKYSPTLLIDEVDTFLKGNEELRGVLNSGHFRATARVLRSVGEDFEPRAFATFAPVAIAGIGNLPPTLEDRSIVVKMRRKMADEKVPRLRRDRIRQEVEGLRRKAVRFVRDHGAELKGADPEIPDELNDRAADNWRPLLSIADLAGGSWPERARRSALALSVGHVEADRSYHVQVLSDMRDLFNKHKAVRLPTARVIAELMGMEGRPWAEYQSSKGITARQVSQLLRPFGVRPRQLWRDSKNQQGYLRDDFEDAFQRYLPPTNPLDPLEPNRGAIAPGVAHPVQFPSSRASEKSREPR